MIGTLGLPPSHFETNASYELLKLPFYGTYLFSNFSQNFFTNKSFWNVCEVWTPMQFCSVDQFRVWDADLLSFVQVQIFAQCWDVVVVQWMRHTIFQGRPYQLSDKEVEAVKIQKGEDLGRSCQMCGYRGINPCLVPM